MIRLSANLGFLWPDRPLLDRIAAAGRAGFGAIELHWPYDTPPDAVRTACAAAGVELLALNTALGDAARGDSGLGAVPGREGEFQAQVDQAIGYARAAGAGAIHAMAGVAPRSGRATLLANLATAAEKAAPHGLTLLLEALNPRDKPGYFYHSVDAVADVIATLGHPAVRMMFDVYHVGVAEGDVLTRLARHMPVIGHVQIAAVPSRAEPDEGEIAYGAVFAALARLGYAGWVGCEYKPRGDTDAGLAWRDRLGV